LRVRHRKQIFKKNSIAIAIMIKNIPIKPIREKNCSSIFDIFFLDPFAKKKSGSPAILLKNFRTTTSRSANQPTTIHHIFTPKHTFLRRKTIIPV